MQGLTDSTLRFGQNHVRMRATSLTWATSVGQKAKISGRLFRPSLGSSAWYSLYLNWAAKADSENPFNGQSQCNTCGSHGWVCQTDFSNAYEVKIH